MCWTRRTWNLFRQVLKYEQTNVKYWDHVSMSVELNSDLSLAFCGVSWTFYISLKLDKMEHVFSASESIKLKSFIEFEMVRLKTSSTLTPISRVPGLANLSFCPFRNQQRKINQFRIFQWNTGGPLYTSIYQSWNWINLTDIPTWPRYLTVFSPFLMACRENILCLPCSARQNL